MVSVAHNMHLLSFLITIKTL